MATKHRIRRLTRLLRGTTEGGQLTTTIQPGDRASNGYIRSITVASPNVTGHHGATSLSISPAEVIANRITAALDPVRTPGKARYLADMTPEEVAALEAQYGCAVGPGSDRSKLFRRRRIAGLARRQARLARAKKLQDK